MIHRFSWRGEPIADIHAWARDRGDRIVRFRAERKVPNIFTGQLDTESYEGEMPGYFWDGLMMTNGWRYTEIDA